MNIQKYVQQVCLNWRIILLVTVRPTWVNRGYNRNSLAEKHKLLQELSELLCRVPATVEHRRGGGVGPSGVGVKRQYCWPKLLDVDWQRCQLCPVFQLCYNKCIIWNVVDSLNTDPPPIFSGICVYWVSYSSLQA